MATNLDSGRHGCVGPTDVLEAEKIPRFPPLYHRSDWYNFVPVARPRAYEDVGLRHSVTDNNRAVHDKVPPNLAR